ncbi:MAG: hypothetical protein PHX62_06690, partial [Bacilli bacterium]|nr:hypothetical protein [Bacilli bacterium]
MNRKFRIIRLLIMLFSTLTLFIFVAFAWYASYEKTEPIVINTGSLKAQCIFYRGIDSNLDGILDENTYEEIEEEDLTFSYVIPGQIYTFKLSIKNAGTVAGFLSVSIADIITDEEELLPYFNVEFSAPTESFIPLSDFQPAEGRLELFIDYVLG